jgi:hypothetical protein
MIPQRQFSNELKGSGVRDRVSACRKRLRETRTNTIAARADVEKLFSETSLPATTLRNCAEGDAEEVLLAIELQGVGIT